MSKGSVSVSTNIKLYVGPVVARKPGDEGRGRLSSRASRRERRLGRRGSDDDEVSWAGGKEKEEKKKKKRK
jgi:hypothetical protein